METDQRQSPRKLLKVSARLTVQGAEVYTMAPAEFTGFFENERKRWAGVVAKGGIKLD